MLSRREPLRSFASLASFASRAGRRSLGSVVAAVAVAVIGPAELGAASLGAQGCSRPTDAAPTKPAPEWPRHRTYSGLDVIELFPNHADESAPLVIAVHGMGDAPENWVETWRTFPARAHIVLPRAFTKYGQGYSWFPLREGMTDAELGREVGAAEEKLWRGIAAIAGTRRPIVTGFSQGGILSFAMAARHANEIAYAFPVAGSCPGPLLPKEKAKSAPLIAFHGTDDEVIAFKWGTGAVNAFKEQGADATLKPYPGVGHAMPPAMRADVWAEIQRVLARAQ